jgi:predicted CXXCH cytochrome family protein
MATSKGTKLTILLIALVLMFASPVLAGIVGSKHDFSATNTLTTPFAGVWETTDPVTGFPLIISEVCVFCHTPHNASKNIPGMTTPMWLWNRTNSPPAGYSYAMYSSVTMSATTSAAPTGVSMMCMSCHDGVTSIAVGTLLNAPGSGNPTVTPNGINPPGAMGNVYNGGFIGFGPNIGGVYPGGSSTTIDLSNDHPVSFDWPSNEPGLRSIASITSALRLFGTTNRVECATCHTVHDPTNVPFLAMSNDNSAMCTECHLK